MKMIRRKTSTNAESRHGNNNQTRSCVGSPSWSWSRSYPWSLSWNRHVFGQIMGPFRHNIRSWSKMSNRYYSKMNGKTHYENN